MIDDPKDDFSFSGLKTSVRYFLRDHPDLLDDAQRLRDLCASVQAAIVDVLVTKTIRAARRLRVGCVTASGGVSCNRSLRQRLTAACARERLVLLLAEKSLCTDNAAMIGILAERKLRLRAEATSSRRGYPSQLGAGLEPARMSPRGRPLEPQRSGARGNDVSPIPPHPTLAPERVGSSPGCRSAAIGQSAADTSPSPPGRG